MASLSNSDFQEHFFHCSICTDRFRDPKVLPCQHSFCKECLDSYIEQEISKGQGQNGFLCPYCRTFTKVSSSLPHKRWTDDLVTNFNLMNMMEALNLDKDRQFKPCEVHQKDLEYFCKTHQGDICSDCAVFDHRNCEMMSASAIKAQRQIVEEFTGKCSVLCDIDNDFNRQISQLSESKTEIQQVLKAHFNEMREKLNNAEIDQLNLLEDKFHMEQSMLIEKQQDCRGILRKFQSFLQEVESKQETFDLGQYEKDAKPMKAKLDSYIKSINKSPKAVLLSKSEAELQRRMESFSEIVGEVLLNFSSEESPAKEQGSVAAGNSNELDEEPPPSYSSAMQSYSTDGGRVPVFATFSLGQMPVPLAGGIQAGGVPSHTLVYPSVDLPTQPPVPLHMQGIPVHYPMEPLVYPHANLAPPLPNQTPRCLQLAASFNAKTLTDKTNCWLTGGIILSNGNIALADRNNKKIKLFSATFYCIAEMHTQSYPFDLTETCTGEIAVTLPKDNRVRFYNARSLGLLSHDIDTEQSCLGITSGHERLFVCCDTTWGKLGCIKIYDKFNQLLIKITKDNNNKDIVSITDYITVCPVSGNLFFKRGGLSKECVYCTTNQGTVLWKSKVPSWLDVPMGLCVLNEGVLVSIGSLKWLHPGGRKWEKLLDSEDISSPCALSVNNDKTTLLITQVDSLSNCKENNLVKMYAIVYQF